MNPDTALDYLDFVVARHQLWERRQTGEPGPWTDNPILQRAKFTNVYRVLDPGSQYVVTNLVADDAPWADKAFRCFMYRYTNRPEPWAAFEADYGRPPVIDDLMDGTLAAAWTRFREAGGKMFSTAYQITQGKLMPGAPKDVWLIENAKPFWGDREWVKLLRDSYPGPDRAEVLYQIPRCAEFMAMQVLTDIGYFDSSHDENAWVLPGPGSRRGAAAVGMKPHIAFEWAFNHFREPAESVILDLGDGVKRSPSLMDIQNTFCEFSKYWRYKNGGVPRGYRPKSTPPPAPVYPDHWRRSDASILV